MWLVGLLGFAHAEKALAVWWLVSLPLAAAAAARVPEPASPRRRAQLAWIPIGFGLLFCLEHYVDGRALRAQEGTLRTRSLPGDWYAGLEQLASWLDVHAHPAQRARLFTTFNLGSYLTWRLPRYSASIDSRTIFPDSVAAPEAMTVRAFAGTELGPWRDADVAIVPHDYPVAAVLDTATGWQRVVLAPGGKKAPGLWARSAWLDSAGVRTLR
jgi:hypothetical protein